MEGSAAVIGEMMLPVLEPTSPEAYAPARSLGLAFQLTNFLRDIDEDLDRGRVYVPQVDLRRFGVDLAARRASQEFKAFLAYQIERNRALYSFADTGNRAAAAALGPLCRHRAGALLPDPRSDRGRRLRRLLRPGPGAHLAQGADRRPHHGRRAAGCGEPGQGKETQCRFGRGLVRYRRALSDRGSRSPGCRSRGRTGCPRPGDWPNRRGSPARCRPPRPRTPAAGSWREPAPTSGARSRSPGPSRAARWSSGGRRTAPWWPGRAPARIWARCSIAARCWTARCTAAGTASGSRPAATRPGARTAPTTTAC